MSVIMHMPSTMPGTALPGAQQGEHTQNAVMQPWLDGIGTGVAWLDAGLKVEYCNQRFRQLLTEGGVLLGPGSLLVQLGLSATTIATATRKLASGRSWKKLLRREARALKLVLNPLPPPAAGQKALVDCSYSVMLDDYSGELRQLQLMAEARHHAERSDKAKSRFLAQMSHELRTPLNAILGFTQLLQLSPGLGREQQDNLGEIATAGNYLLTLINEILDLGNIEAGKINLNREAVAMARLLPDCIALMEPLAAPRQIRLSHEGGECLVHTDHVRLKQIVLNLLGNAIKYNIHGGEVRLNCSAKGRRLRLEVQDSGPGIEPARQDSIFKPFERLGTENSMVEGSGIGLMITRRLVHMMHADIGVLSVPGRGSVFWVEFVENPGLHREMLPETSGNHARDKTAELLYLGPPSGLFDCLRQLATLRPGLRICHCSAATELPPSMGPQTLVLIDATQPLPAVLPEQLKATGAAVVMACTDGDFGTTGDGMIPARINTSLRLPALLAVLDAHCRSINSESCRT